MNQPTQTYYVSFYGGLGSRVVHATDKADAMRQAKELNMGRVKWLRQMDYKTK